MAMDEKRACLWHAFNALDVQKSGMVVKSQLKVLTHNISSCLGVANAEKALDDYRSTPTISFRDFLYFLKVELFAVLQNSDVTNSNTNLDKVDEVCWFLCGKTYQSRENKTLEDSLVYKLWRIFNYVAETESTEGDLDILYPVVIDSDEAIVMAKKLIAYAGHSTDNVDFTGSGEGQWDFLTFLGLIEVNVCLGLSPDVVKSAVEELYEEIIVQVTKRGYLVKKGHMMTTWKERWFVLTPNVMKYYTTREEKDLKGEIAITAACRVETLPERTGHKPHRFQVVTDGRAYEISAPDTKTRNEWMTAVKSAIEQCANPLSMQKAAFQKRKAARDARRMKAKEEEDRRRQDADLMDQTRQQLLEEKQARAEAEVRLQEEAARREEEAKRRIELEEIQKQLEALLEEERQAKRDEEIVRNLQARILREEFEKREELEALQAQMSRQLEEERAKREGLEELQAKQTTLLEEEKQKLHNLEEERKAADNKLKEALAKLQLAEKAKVDLHEKIKEKENLRPPWVLRSASAEVMPSSDVITHRGKGAFAQTGFRTNITVSTDNKTKDRCHDS